MVPPIATILPRSPVDCEVSGDWLVTIEGQSMVSRSADKVIVIGAGVVGTATAYYLGRAGFEVTVLERQAGPALETSFANAGEVSPGYASPWAAPDVPKKIPRWLLMRHAPLILRPRADPKMLHWITMMLRNCTTDRYATNKSRMMRLAMYSLRQLIELREATGITYDERARGTLQLFRSQAQLDGVAKDVAVLERSGVAYEVLDREGCFAAEPGLRFSSQQIVGGLRLPGDETGDCYKFTNAVAELAGELGVRFEYNTHVTSLERSRSAWRVDTSEGAYVASKVVLAAGSFSAGLAATLGLKVPVYPVKGYSLTMPIEHFDRAPESTLLDESYKIAITRLGDRVRVGGMAEISGYDLGITENRKVTLLHSLTSLFPGLGRTDKAEFWSGLRPMTPDGPPIVGATALPGLYLNTGHGTLGWTMSCGSGRLLADLLAEQRPEVRWDDLSLDRYLH